MNTHQPAICINSVQIGFKYPHHRTNKVYECEHLKSRNTTPVSYDGKWWWSVNIWNETNETIVYIGQLQWITLIRSEFHLVLNVLSCAWWHTDTSTELCHLKFNIDTFYFSCYWHWKCLPWKIPKYSTAMLCHARTHGKFSLQSQIPQPKTI